ncbi:hypothetical protein SHELI_v1c11220 [Spiroplasma helicoides]|uniref:Uncharacterized protein n=1 Tax=Spiroplasma helicoides TaxID=216938 RepID=A0A1B3SMA7_9MOLU|nr:hypothetical protein [Spiroplasma helicoides]AOG61069.1 hypothetical protein SHELI_v1c11220 [Spiroplasma helicoides]
MIFYALTTVVLITIFIISFIIFLSIINLFLNYGTLRDRSLFNFIREIDFLTFYNKVIEKDFKGINMVIEKIEFNDDANCYKNSILQANLYHIKYDNKKYIIDFSKEKKKNSFMEYARIYIFWSAYQYTKFAEFFSSSVLEKGGEFNSNIVKDQLVRNWVYKLYLKDENNQVIKESPDTYNISEFNLGINFNSITLKKIISQMNKNIQNFITLVTK